MTTIAYDRRTKTIGADSRNTDGSDQIFSINKIERLSDGRGFFLGSGHCYSIALAKAWADTGFDPKKFPDWTFLLENKDEYGLSCLIISSDGNKVILFDDELTPMVVEDDIITTGSGGIAAKAALMAGATMEQAIEIAIHCDNNSGLPVRTYRIINDSESK